MKRYLPLIAVAVSALFLAACPTSLIPKLHIFDSIAEVEVDALIDEKEERRCRWPVDILERTVDRRGAAWFSGWLESCPAADRLFRSSVK